MTIELTEAEAASLYSAAIYAEGVVGQHRPSVHAAIDKLHAALGYEKRGRPWCPKFSIEGVVIGQGADKAFSPKPELP